MLTPLVVVVVVVLHFFFLYLAVNKKISFPRQATMLRDVVMECPTPQAYLKMDAFVANHLAVPHS